MKIVETTEMGPTATPGGEMSLPETTRFGWFES